jgi:serine/threonine protein kinase/tetratricopeptide (TPR) repeat protein
VPLTPRTRLGPYEIVALLGAGGMGEVYRARDPRLGRDVALKVLPEALALSPDRLARFEREAKTVAGLNHPNIVVLHSIEEHDGIRFLTMELVEGQSLDRHLTTGGLPLARVLELGTALAEALAAAHEKGVVHRDLKPANVIVTQDGRLKVLDFGLAKLASANPDPAAIPGPAATHAPTMTGPLTSEGAVLGTVPYMAPEQIRGEVVDARGDLFALGIVLYELATGVRPFTGKTSADIGSAILRDTPRPLRSIRAELPRDFERIIDRCLEKNPRLRAQSALDVANELRRLATPGRTQESLDDRPSLVVLPFANLNRDPENEYFSDGLTEEVIADLARIQGLRVISRTSAMRLKGADKDLATLTRELSVRYALEGGVRKAGNDLRITVRLVDAQSDAPLWSEKYSGTLEDVFAIQERVSRSIADSLRVQLTAEEDRHRKARPTPNAYAFDTYLRTRRDIWSFVPERMERARLELTRALEVVGEDPFLHAGLALVSWQYLNAGISADPRYLAEAEKHARKVMELDPDGAQGPRLLGLICAQNRDLVGEVRYLQRAYEIDPHDSHGAAWVAFAWTFAGQPHRTRPIFEKLLAVDPHFDYLLFGMTFDAYLSGDLERAERYAEQSRRLSPDYPLLPLMMAQIFASNGQIERAVRFVEDHAPRADAHPLATLAHIFKHALLGEAAAMDALSTDTWLEKVWNDSQYTHALAQANAIVGRNDQALHWLQRATHSLIHYPFLSEHDRLLDNLRADDRFVRLLESVRVRWERFERDVASG